MPQRTRRRTALLGLSLFVGLALACATPAPRSAAPAGQAPAPPAAAPASQATAPNPPAAPAGPPRTLTLGLANKTFTQVPQWAAESQGYFTAEGINVESVYTNASTTIIAAMVSGTMDVATTSPGNAILTRQKGTNLVVVGGYVNRAMYNMLGMKGLSTLDDLRGRRIGVAGTSTGDSLLIREVMGSKGMRENDDYQFVRIGGTPERYNALFSGAIDAVTLLDPFNYAALDAGFPNLANVYEYVPEYVHAATSVHADWARQNEAALVGYLKAVIRGIRWTYDPANREAALKLAVDNTGVERKFAEMALDEHSRVTAWPKDGWVNEKGLEWVINQAANVGDLEPPYPTVQDVSDPSYTRKALSQIDK
jgi:ABC-type nitrate/sulfonate/bicarbonate transport system substrate-binding protein